jgi:murein tripeptide amidase MpaA
MWKKVQTTQTKNTAYFTFDSCRQIKALAENTALSVVWSQSAKLRGRDIWALKVSDNPDKNEAEPAALLMGAHHAREWPSIEVPMATAKKLLEEYETSAEIKELVDNREIWIVPMVNPDGVVYSMEKSRYWRKNRRNNGGTFGVDLNRNYGYQWGSVGASSSGSSDTIMEPVLSVNLNQLP